MNDYLKEMDKHTRKQRLRNVRRKTGNKSKNKKPRQNNWLSKIDELDEMAYDTHERILPRGEMERRKTIEKIAFQKKLQTSNNEVSKSSTSDQVLNDPNKVKGLVIEVGGGSCRVVIDGKTILCNLRGNLMSRETGYTNVLAVGDRVIVSLKGNEQGVVEEIQSRHNVLSRAYIPNKGKTSSLRQIIVANVDQVLIVASWREPHLWPELIDRYLITAQLNRLDATICINKIDLIDDDYQFQAELKPYRNLGYGIFLTSARKEVGILNLESRLRGKTTVLMGLSGVGKSSLIQAVQPDINLRIGDVVAGGVFKGQGSHTTTQATLLELDNGSFVIDTPGIRNFGLTGLRQGDLAYYYPEMTAYLGKCKYSNCVHRGESGCAIYAAVEQGMISKIRYKNYCNIFDTLPG